MTHRENFAALVLKVLACRFRMEFVIVFTSEKKWLLIRSEYCFAMQVLQRGAADETVQRGDEWSNRLAEMYRLQPNDISEDGRISTTGFGG